MIEKARLYFLLKQINRAGEALWMDNPVKQDAYNLHILHRRGTKKAKDEAPDGAAEPDAKA